MPTPNQKNNETSQNFEPDIDKIYSDFIQEIDANRSLVNIGSSFKIEDTPQESRAHCFFRLIGFPVVDKDKNYYNPGLDNTTGSSISSDKKNEIANNVSLEFNILSSARENYTNKIDKIWSQRPPTITASVLALSSGLNIRSFNVSFQNDDPLDPFDFSLNKQNYTANFNAATEKNNIVDLMTYVDSNGKKPDQALVLKNRSHFIRPFIVDPRIDFSCKPASRQIAVPFVDGKNQLLVSENTYVKRPLIERVIRDRFSNQNQKDISPAQSKIRESILDFKGFIDEDLLNKMTKDIYSLEDATQFKKYLLIIDAMCKKLVEAQKIIESAQTKYYWLPQPSTIGPEGGSEIANIIISDSLDKKFITKEDESLIRANLYQAVQSFNSQIIEQEIQDAGNFVFDNFHLTFDNSTTTALGDHIQKDLDSLNKKRNTLLTEANKALRTVEIIMGEFSGLGLCDIIAIMGALYVMPKDKLLGFLDSDAFARMIIRLNLKTSDLKNSNIVEAQQAFIAKVKDFYNLMEDLYKQKRKNNGLST